MGTPWHPCQQYRSRPDRRYGRLEATAQRRGRRRIDCGAAARRLWDGRRYRSSRVVPGLATCSLRHGYSARCRWWFVAHRLGVAKPADRLDARTHLTHALFEQAANMPLDATRPCGSLLTTAVTLASSTQIDG